MVAVPIPAPVTIPLDDPIVATEVLLLAQVPPLGVQLSGEVPPRHSVVTPLMGATELTLIVFVAALAFPHASVAVTV